MNVRFGMVLVPQKPREFRFLDEESREFFARHPEINAVVRAVSAIYREETKDACTTIAIARDLEAALRIVTREPGISVAPMRYSPEKAGKLVEITDDRPTDPAAR